VASWYQGNPYVGARPFTSADRNLFYGRDKEGSQLVALLVAHQVVLLYARSAAGKTSLLQAGVIPAIKEQGQFLVLPIARISGVVFPGLAVDQVANIYVFNLLASLREKVGIAPDELAGLGICEGLEPYLTDRQARTDDQGEEADDPQSRAWNKPRLLILDQVEEIFTSHPERYADRDGFFHQLGECLSKRPELGLLISMREDYLAQLDSYAAHIPDRLRSRFRLERLDKQAAINAVRGPAEAAGLPFAPDVAEALVDNLRRIRLQSREPGEGTISQFLAPDVEPVSLQVTCRGLWDRLLLGATSIEMADLEAFGDVDAALAGLYDSALSRVASATGVSERQVRTWFDEKMITPAGTRRLAYRDEEITEGLPNIAVQYLEESYIVRAVRRGVDTWYELAHDRLIAPIRDSNRRWGA
jgi:hypothetical protein